MLYFFDVFAPSLLDEDCCSPSMPKCLFRSPNFIFVGRDKVTMTVIEVVHLLGDLVDPVIACQRPRVVFLFCTIVIATVS